MIIYVKTCSTCEYYNARWKYLESGKPVMVKGDCMFPHRMNIDPIENVKKLEDEDKLVRALKHRNESCEKWTSACCYATHDGS